MLGRLRPLAVSIGVFALVMALIHFGVSTERRRQQQEIASHVSHEALALVAKIETELNANVFLANGMVAHLIAQGGVTDEKADRALQALHQYGRHIRNIGIAPGNRISNVYPLEANKAAIGLYYPDVPQQWPAVKRAIDTRATVLAGPVALRQGGNGLISRTPVFLPDGSYWGVVSIVLDSDSLFEAVGLRDMVDGVRYAVRGKDGLGAKGEVFLGDPSLFGAADTFDITVPGGTWQLGATPVEGWFPERRELLGAEIVGGLLALLLAAAAYGYQIGTQRIAENEQRLRTFLQTTPDGIIVIDRAGIVQEFNPASENMFGYSAAEMVGLSVNILMPEAEAGEHDRYLTATRDDQAHKMARGREVHGRRKDGSEFPVEITVGGVEIGGRHIHVGVIRDITERKAVEQKLVELATTDSMTGALNRRAFLEKAEAAFTLAKRHARPLSLMMIDADHFKQINDTYGHQVGDAVLVRLSAVCQAAVRATDSFGRFGGEEFVALLPETDLEHALDVADRLLEVIRKTEVASHGHPRIRFTVSIGVATCSEAMSSLDELLRSADEALYVAKAQGRDQRYFLGAELPAPDITK